MDLLILDVALVIVAFSILLTAFFSVKYFVLSNNEE